MYMTSPDAPTRDFDVRLATDADQDSVLGALSDGYARPFTHEWFRWKHQLSPWGASRCFVAEDAEGLLGVVFEMPWRYAESGGPAIGWRMVDGATTVRAQRRGVFRAVVAAMLSDCAASEEQGVVLATATPEARLAHIKNGAVALEPISSYYRPAVWRPAVWRPAQVVSGLDVLDSWQLATQRGLASVWDRASLEWRLDPRSGIEYQVSRLASGSGANGAIHRTVGGAARTVVISALWGAPSDVRTLVGALAWRSKAVAVLAPGGPGTRLAKPRLGVARGQSLMCVWDQRDHQPAPELSDARDGWALDGLDLEGVI
jgi:hypothetical protein